MDLRGASAESLRELTAELDEALGGSGGDRVATELYDVASLLRAEPALRRFLTDASLPADAKQGLAGQVLEGKVDDHTWHPLGPPLEGFFEARKGPHVVHHFLLRLPTRR